MVAAAICVIFPLCLAMAACSDLLTMTIPNRISLVLALSFLVIAPFAALPLPAIAMHLAAALIVFGVCFALFSLNVMGGGDAKLLSAAAIWFGFNQSLLIFVVYVGFIGGLLTLLILMIRARWNTILAMGLPVPNSIILAKKIPYGIAIAAGGFLAFPYSPLFTVVLESMK